MIASRFLDAINLASLLDVIQLVSEKTENNHFIHTSKSSSPRLLKYSDR